MCFAKILLLYSSNLLNRFIFDFVHSSLLITAQHCFFTNRLIVSKLACHWCSQVRQGWHNRRAKKKPENLFVIIYRFCLFVNIDVPTDVSKDIKSKSVENFYRYETQVCSIDK